MERPGINKSPELEMFLEHHRFYSNRTWQYFGAILLINSLLFSAIKDLKDLPELITIASFMSITIIGVFYHLINWTDMRIDNNMERVNKLLENPIPEHRTTLENTINWSKFGIFVITIPYFYLTLKNNTSCLVFCLLLIIFLAIIIISERTRRKFESKHKLKK